MCEKRTLYTPEWKYLDKEKPPKKDRYLVCEMTTNGQVLVEERRWLGRQFTKGWYNHYAYAWAYLVKIVPAPKPKKEHKK